MSQFDFRTLPWGPTAQPISFQDGLVLVLTRGALVDAMIEYRGLYCAQRAQIVLFRTMKSISLNFIGSADFRLQFEMRVGATARIVETQYHRAADHILVSMSAANSANQVIIEPTSEVYLAKLWLDEPGDEKLPDLWSAHNS